MASAAATMAPAHSVPGATPAKASAAAATAEAQSQEVVGAALAQAKAVNGNFDKLSPEARCLAVMVCMDVAPTMDELRLLCDTTGVDIPFGIGLYKQVQGNFKGPRHTVSEAIQLAKATPDFERHHAKDKLDAILGQLSPATPLASGELSAVAAAVGTTPTGLLELTGSTAPPQQAPDIAAALKTAVTAAKAGIPNWDAQPARVKLCALLHCWPSEDIAPEALEAMQLEAGYSLSEDEAQED